MKKLLLIYLLFFVTILCFSQVPINSTTNGSDVWYYIKGTRGQSATALWATAKADNTKVLHEDLTGSDAQKWKVVSNGAGLALVNKAYGTYMNTDATYNGGLGTVVAMPSNQLTIELSTSNESYKPDGAVTIYKTGAAGTFRLHAGGSPSGWFNYNDINDNCSFLFVPATYTSAKALLYVKIKDADFLKSVSTIGTIPGTYKQADYDSFSSAITAANTVLSNASTTDADDQNATTTLNNAINTFKASVNTIKVSTINSTTSTWYYIVSTNSGYSLNNVMVDYESGSNKINWTTNDAALNKYWRFVSSSNGSYKIQNRSSLQYIGLSNSWSNVTLSATGNDYLVSFLGQGQMNLYENGKIPLHAAQSGSEVVSWSGGLNSASSWKLVEAPVVSGYANLKALITIANAMTTAKYPTGTKLGMYSATMWTAFQTALTNANAFVALGETDTQENINVQKNALQTAINNLNNSLVKPTTSSGATTVWYIVLGTRPSNTYLTSGGAGVNTTSATLITPIHDTQLWKVVANGTGVALVNKATGEYLNSDIADNSALPTKATIPTTTLRFLASTEQINGAYKFWLENNVGTSNSFRLHAGGSNPMNWNGNAGDNCSWVFTETLHAVTPVATSATSIGTTSFTANWNAISAATSYYLDVATDASFTNILSGYNNLSVGNITSKTVTNLNCNTTYYYRIRAYNNTTSLNSNVITAQTLASLNLALTATATASSFHSAGYEANKINDDDAVSTRWATWSLGAGQWIQLDFPTATTFNKVVTMEHSTMQRVTAYQLQIWDGAAWVNIVNGTTMGTNKMDIFTPVTTTKLRLNITASTDAPTIMEMQVFNAALSATATASSTWTQDAGYTADKVADNDINTRWSAGPGATSNTWLELDFGTAVSFNKSIIKEISYNRISSYKLQYSTDNGSTWLDILFGTTVGSNKIDFFPTITAKKIRLFALTSSDSPTINEFNIYYDGTINALNVENNHELTVNTNLTSPTITVKPTAKLTVAAGNTLNISGNLILQSDANGTATIKNLGTLNVSGTVTIQQYLPTTRNWYISSPFSNATSSNFTSCYEYIEAGNNTDLSIAGSTAYWKGVASASALSAGKGYVAGATAGTTVSLTGTLNNADSYAIPITRTTSASKQGFNLVGNPYPAYIDWSLVTADVSNANVGATFWYRTKNTSDAYTFATHNGVSTVTVTGTANTEITRFIPPMQAFWVRVNEGTAATNLTIKKSMLAHRDVTNNKFKAPQGVEQSLVRILVNNGVNTDELVLYFNANAQNGYDAYDSPKMFNNSTVIAEIYTQVDNEKLVINGMKVIPYNTEIPVGFSTSQAGTFTFSLGEFSQFASGTQLILKDALKPTEETDLSQGGTYQFTADVTPATTSRFSLVFRAPGSVTGTSDAAAKIMQAFVNTDGAVTLKAPVMSVYSISNALGQKVAEGKTTHHTQVLSTHLTPGVYVVTIVNNSRKYSSKLIVR